MLLNQRQHTFVVLFPDSFFSKELKEKFSFYKKQLLLPYGTIDDYFASTVQSVDFPGWSMDLKRQTRMLGAQQDFKNATPVKDLMSRKFTLTFRLTDGYLNYFMFYKNAIDYLDFKNKQQYFDNFKFLMLNNEGYMIGYIDFHMLVLHSLSNVKLDYSNMERTLNSFNAEFTFNDWDLTLMYNDKYPKI